MSQARCSAALSLWIAGCTCAQPEGGGTDALGRTRYVLKLPAHMSQPPIPEHNPLTEEGVRLGRMLFYDPLLSGNNTQSCASCHQQALGFTDGRAIAIGAEGTYARRNTMSLTNLAWSSALMWDGRASTLEAQALFPLTDANEMNQDLEELVAELESHPVYPSKFAEAFPGSEISADRVTDALAQFVRTLTSFDAPLDHLATLVGEGIEFNLRQQRGSDLLTARLPKGDPEGTLDLCNVCHDQFQGLKPGVEKDNHDLRGLFVGTELAHNGLPDDPGDPGGFALSGDPMDRGKFVVPTMRNIGRTGPYMHDGRFETLHEVLEHYDSHMQDLPQLDPRLRKDGAVMKMGLTESNIDDMVALLEMFTDETFLTNPDHADPFAAGLPDVVE
jgi:cytochrome c peroxidase